ncbi:MAG TPA: type II toxin-antitoxin system VapC family toxin [Thermoanaerobaculia bacterium]|nr:type II toxin-antitoxin system VapC family toxin [Thermoanaerobaculia bacterium]
MGRGQVIVADTHSWVWWLTDREMLSAPAREALKNNAVAVSTITFLEVATLVRRGRITLDQPLVTWLQRSIERSSTRVFDLTLEVAAAAGSLESDVIRDPADRIIVATALLQGVPLVTKDHKILASAVVPTIW